MGEMELSLEKFGSIGGDYFEHLVAAALDELGYVEGETYIPSWSKRCVPGTWIEADFIIGEKSGTDPENNGRKVFAIGHATSENSAGMKFHRDVEQLLEVKALPNGDDFMVFDILFCCPRETMGGWSEQLVQINEAIFDDSLIIWEHDWGMRLLWQIQQIAGQLKDCDHPQKKKRLRRILDENGALNTEFQYLKNALKKMLGLKRSKSRIQDIFVLERKARKERINSPLLISSKEKTEYKRGLLQVLALNDWELDLLYENHLRNKQAVTSIEKVATQERGMSQEDFEDWWHRLQLLSIKVGQCSQDFDSDNFLDPDEREYRFFEESEELGYVFDHFDLAALREVVRNIPAVAPNLMPYLIDLHDLARAEKVCDLLSRTAPDEFGVLCQECFESDPWLDMDMPRLLVLEVAKAAIKTEVKAYSYDAISNESGNAALIRNPFTMRFIAGKKGNISSGPVKAGIESVASRLEMLPAKKFVNARDAVLEKFVYERFDGMVKQPKASVLDALLAAEIFVFADQVGARVTDAVVQGVRSAFNVFVTADAAGVNVEIPYVLILNSGEKIFVHRVNANDGHAADKRKEFSSKIRTIRYESYKSGFRGTKDYYASVLVLDGNWIKPGKEDPYAHVRMLTTAGWDYVVYPDQLQEAFLQIESNLKTDGLI